MATGCFFTLQAGRVAEMRVPRGLSATAANTYREIGSVLQFARSTEAVPSYSAEEYDTTGQYVAEYERDPGERDSWRKRKQRYISILAVKTTTANVPVRVVPEIISSHGEIQLTPDGHLAAVHSYDEIVVNGAQQPVRSLTSVSLEQLPAPNAQKRWPDWDALMSGMQRVGADEPYGPPASIESLDSARISGLTFEQAVSGFEQLVKQGGPQPVSAVNGATLDSDEKAKREQRTQEESRLFVALAAILREQPQAVAAAVRRIHAKSPASDILVQALSSAASPASLRALADLTYARTDADPVMRNRAALALSRTPRPDNSAIAAMTAMLKSDPFSEQALLGLGSFSRRLRDAGDNAKAVELGELLLARLKSADNTTKRLTTLRAIANSGYAPALPQVLPYISDDQEQIRVDAVGALQSMHDPEVDRILAERLDAESSSNVRMSAIDAAKVREPTDVLAHAIERSARNAADPHVRYRAVEVLAAWVPRRPDLRPALEQVAANDPETRIRDRAKSAL